jgi:hypothetical protein
MASVLDQIKQRAAERRDDHEARYLAAIRQAASGEEVDPDAIVLLLEEVGTSADEFAADVGRHQERIRLHDLVTDAPCHERLRAEATAAIAAIDAEHDEYERQYLARRRVHEEAAAKAASALSVAHQAGNDLFRTARPALHQRLAKLEADRRANDQVMREATERQFRGQANLTGAERAGNTSEAGAVRRRLADYDREVAACKAEWQRLTDAIVALTAEMHQP